MPQSTIPPEVAFDRYLREFSRYRGKQELDRLNQPDLQKVLEAIQGTFNEALRNEKRDVPGHVEHAPFHFDYIDSGKPNAHAFCDGQYSFIGLTMGLVDLLGNLCVRLSRSDAVATQLGITLPTGDDGLQPVLFQTLIGFIVAHEFTHHVHGHMSQREIDSFSFNEIEDDGEIGDLEQQTMEVDADSYAAYHSVPNLLEGNTRHITLSVLRLNDQTAEVQDEVLFSCFVAVVGAFLFSRRPVDVDRTNIYRLTHPPQAARLNFLMEGAISWCRQNRPALVNWMTKKRFQSIMRAVAEATWGMNGFLTWEAQVAFLQTETGNEYMRRLGESLKAYVAAL